LQSLGLVDVRDGGDLSPTTSCDEADIKYVFCVRSNALLSDGGQVYDIPKSGSSLVCVVDNIKSTQ